MRMHFFGFWIEISWIARCSQPTYSIRTFAYVGAKVINKFCYSIAKRTQIETSRRFVFTIYFNSISLFLMEFKTLAEMARRTRLSFSLCTDWHLASFAKISHCIYSHIQQNAHSQLINQFNIHFSERKKKSIDHLPWNWDDSNAKWAMSNESRTNCIQKCIPKTHDDCEWLLMDASHWNRGKKSISDIRIIVCEAHGWLQTIDITTNWSHEYGHWARHF